MKIKFLYQWIAAFFLIMVIASCAKDAAKATINTSYSMLADKTWYLQYTVTNIGGKDSTKSFVGQPTYFIRYNKNLSTLDSDGIEGVYSIQNNTNKLLLQFTGKTANGNSSNYDYEIINIGAKYLALSYSKGTSTIKLFYSTEKQ